MESFSFVDEPGEDLSSDDGGSGGKREHEKTWLYGVGAGVCRRVRDRQRTGLREQRRRWRRGGHRRSIERQWRRGRFEQQFVEWRRFIEQLVEWERLIEQQFIEQQFIEQQLVEQQLWGTDVRSVRASVLGHLHREHAGDGMFYFTNLFGLCPCSKWFAYLYAAGSLRRNLQRWVSEERILLRLRVDVLRRCGLSDRTNLHERHVQRWWWDLRSVRLHGNVHHHDEDRHVHR